MNASEDRIRRSRRTRLDIIRDKQDQIQAKIAKHSDAITELQREYDLLEEEARGIIEQKEIQRREFLSNELLNILNEFDLSVEQLRDIILKNRISENPKARQNQE